MENARIKLAAALVATLGFALHGTAHAANNVQNSSSIGGDSTLSVGSSKYSKVELSSKDKKCDGASCKKAKGKEGSCKGKEGSCKGKEGSCKGKEGSCKGKDSSCKGKDSSCKGKDSSCKSTDGATEAK